MQHEANKHHSSFFSILLWIKKVVNHQIEPGDGKTTQMANCWEIIDYGSLGITVIGSRCGGNFGRSPKLPPQTDFTMGYLKELLIIRTYFLL
jgi:hypothetical protein